MLQQLFIGGHTIDRPRRLFVHQLSKLSLEISKFAHGHLYLNVRHLLWTCKASDKVSDSLLWVQGALVVISNINRFEFYLWIKDGGQNPYSTLHSSTLYVNLLLTNIGCQMGWWGSEHFPQRGTFLPYTWEDTEYCVSEEWEWGDRFSLMGLLITWHMWSQAYGMIKWNSIEYY